MKRRSAMYDNSRRLDITTDELITLFNQLSEADKQTVREFIFAINSSSEREQPLDPQILEN